MGGDTHNSPESFQLLREVILKKLEFLTEFIIGDHYFNNVRYEDVTVLLADTVKKIREPVQKIVKESEKKNYQLKEDNIYLSSTNC